jgi:DNA modification methylase
MIIEIKKISELTPAPYNPRESTEKQESQLKQSLKKFGVVEPIIYNKQTGYIVGGHFRVRELQKLGYTEIECVIVDLSEEDEKELNIRLNANTGQWDWDELANNFELDDLNDWGLEVPNMKHELEAEDDNFEEPENIETDIVLGDLFEIGEHRLLCGDSTDSDAVARLMDGVKADMVLTDPPYNVNYGSNNNPNWKQGDRSIKNDHMSGNDFKDFIQSVVSNIKLFCDGIVYCFGAQGADGRIMFTVLDENLHNSGTIIWLKDRLVLGRSKYHNKYEPCWFGWNKSGDTFTDDRSLTNVFECKRPTKSDLHPTMKPIELLEMPLKHNPKAKSVLDLFLGSGSTMVASHQLKRKCYGMELDPKYCQVIIDRMRKLDPSIKIKRNGVEL